MLFLLTGGVQYDETPDECDFQARQNGDQQYKHGALIFTCDQCEFKTTVQFNLVFHKEVKHDGIRYF